MALPHTAVPHGGRLQGLWGVRALEKPSSPSRRPRARHPRRERAGKSTLIKIWRASSRQTRGA